MAISQTITDVPTPPSSSDATNFRTRADAFMASLDTLATEINTFVTQANALETNVNAKEASTVLASQAAVSSANFQGTWSSATAYVIGESVVYSGVIYRALLNGTNKNPSSSPTYWVAVSVASGIANTPSGTISATDVQGAINELGTEKAPLASPAFTGTPTAPTPSVGDNDTLIATTAFVNAEISNDVGVANSALVKTALNAGGTAPIYACRAWVNFNGTGTVVIRTSGNVSSITDNGVGDYTVNFATAMSDVNYAVNMTSRVTTLSTNTSQPKNTGAYSSSSIQLYVGNSGNGAAVDADIVSVAIFR